MLHGRRQEERICEDPGTVATLRAAMVEPAAPGEDESYRRLMTVIADDLRLRQPVHQRNWAWIPTTSVALAGMILAIIAYDAGVRNGVNLARLHANPPSIARNETPANDITPTYVPPVKPGVPQPRMKIKEIPGAPPNESSNTILAWLQNETLTKDQQEFVRLAGNKADQGDWDGVTRLLVQMADADPTADASISAIHAAAEIRVNNSDATGAKSLYEREISMCDTLLASEQDPDHIARLKEWRSRAQSGVADLNAASPSSQPAEPAATTP
jgi:hypothetical protein